MKALIKKLFTPFLLSALCAMLVAGCAMYRTDDLLMGDSRQGLEQMGPEGQGTGKVKKVKKTKEQKKAEKKAKKEQKKAQKNSGKGDSFHPAK